LFSREAPNSASYYTDVKSMNLSTHTHTHTHTHTSDRLTLKQCTRELVGLTTLPPSFANCLEIWEPHPPGILKACQGL